MPPTVTPTFDDVDKALLTELQKGFPVDHRPFELLGNKIDLSEQQCLKRVEKLKSDGVIRQLSAIFDTRSLGYQSTLVAMRVDDNKIDAAAEVINQHPGVSHNYKRNDSFNLWYTLAVPPYDSIEKVVNILHSSSGAEETIILPTLRLYKIGMKLDLTKQESAMENQSDIYDEKRRMAAKPPLSNQDIRLISIMQEDLPLIEMPYSVWAEQAETTEEELFDWAKKMQHQGYMRRFAAILYHRKAGFKANAMVVWQIPEEKVDAVGEQLAQYRQVSHCYRRPVYPNWRYPLFTMLHAETYSACMDIVKQMEEKVGQFPHKNLFSTKEYKKIRLKYFTSDLDTWWKKVGSKVSE